MALYLKPFMSVALTLSALLVAGCGGGGSVSAGAGTNISAPADGTIQILDSFGRPVYTGASGGHGSDGYGDGDSGADGSAGDGLPIVGAEVLISDASSPPKTVTAMTDGSGYYRAKVTGFSAPLVARITRPDGAVRYSVSVAPLKANTFVTLNITSLTSQIVADLARAAEQSGPDALTASMVRDLLQIQPNLIADSVNTLKATLVNVIRAADLDYRSFDPLSVPFPANFSGYDFVLDNSYVPAVPGSDSTEVAPTFVADGLVKAANLAQGMKAVRNLLQDVTNAFESTPAPESIAGFLTSDYLGNGLNQLNAAADYASYPPGTVWSLAGLAPYSGAPLASALDKPLPNVTFDNSGCVSSMWVNIGINGLAYESVKLEHSLSAPTECNGGSWRIAGNQRQYRSRLIPQLEKVVTDSGSAYRSGLYLETLSSQATENPTLATNAYSTVRISGPGLTNLGQYLAGTAPAGYFVPLVPGLTKISSRNVIDDPYYGADTHNPYYTSNLVKPSFKHLEGSSLLQACEELTIGAVGSGAWNTAPTAATPCLDTKAMDAARSKVGFNYTIAFHGALDQLLETDQQRLDVAPFAPAAAPHFTLYPVLKTVSPRSTSIPLTAGTVDASWSLAPGVLPVSFGLKLLGLFTVESTGLIGEEGALLNSSKMLPAAATSIMADAPLPVRTTSVTSGYAHIAASAGGYRVVARKSF